MVRPLSIVLTVRESASSRSLPSLMLALICATAGLSAGCGLILDVDPTGDGSAKDSGAVTDAARDDAPLDSALDGPVPDVPIVVPDCPPLLDDDTVALYTFDTDPATTIRDDGPGGNTGSMVGTVVHVAGRCGQAIRFGTTMPTPFVRIPDDLTWDLAVGSLDFWVRASSFGTGVLSRDAIGNQENGHITVFIGGAGHLIVRLQSIDDANAVYRCSDAPIPLDTWVHVGVNFGAPRVELWVNGARSSRTDNVPMGSAASFSTAYCANNAPVGINGNNEPWLLGGSADRSLEGVTSPTSPFANGEIDELRISKVRRDYSAR